MMSIIRKVLGTIIIFFNGFFSPQAMVRSEQKQAEIDKLTAHLKLYQFNACPFCIKVKRAVKRMALNIELRDAKNDKYYSIELLHEGGRLQVPCLRIIDEKGHKIWLYESSDIIKYLQELIAE